jgi:outer membrane protein assembly factor BamB
MGDEMISRITLTNCAAMVLILASGASQAEQWSRFRGSNGDGQSDASGIPIQWKTGEYAWKKALPGVGRSSPVVWDNYVFVTSANPDNGEQIILAFDARNGEQLWEKRFASGTHHQHVENSYATSTPAVDANRLYVSWLDGDKVTLGAFTHQGEEVWRHQVGSLVEQHGFGTSPVVVGDVVCLDNDTEDKDRSVVTGVNAATGEELWHVSRGTGKTVFATPCVWDSGAGRQLLLTSSMGSGLTAFEPTSGKIAWQVLENDLPDRCVSSPITAGGLVFVSCGSGNNGLRLIAMRPGKEGEMPQEAYRLDVGVPNIPTPVAAGELLFLWHDRGTVSCVDLATGEEHWRQRVNGKFHSSPVRVGDRIYCVSLDGDVVVLAASKEYKLLGRSALEEPVQATPAVASNRIYFRTDASLICLGQMETN